MAIELPSDIWIADEGFGLLDAARSGFRPKTAGLFFRLVSYRPLEVHVNFRHAASSAGTHGTTFCDTPRHSPEAARAGGPEKNRVSRTS